MEEQMTKWWRYSKHDTNVTRKLNPKICQWALRPHIWANCKYLSSKSLEFLGADVGCHWVRFVELALPRSDRTMILRGYEHLHRVDIGSKCVTSRHKHFSLLLLTNGPVSQREMHLHNCALEMAAILWGLDEASMHIVGFKIIDTMGINHRFQGLLGSRLCHMPSSNGELHRDICESI